MTLATKKLRVPPEVNGIQYNFCKNPKCSNFGIPAPEEGKAGVLGPYAITGSGTTRSMRCNGCGEYFSQKSNQAIYEEFLRLTAYRQDTNQVCCPNENCYNHTVPVGTKKAYRSFGTHKSGAKRYQCANPDCRKSVSIPVSTQWQHDTSKNIEIFKMLANKVVLSRIIAMAEINWSTLYHRINYIHKQCLKFANYQEMNFKNMEFKRLYLAVDRQDYQVNWTERKDNRNVTLSAIATADNETGYLFGINPNFDKDTDKIKAQSEANLNGDSQLDPAFRKFARIWLQSDYEHSVTESIKNSIKKLQKNGGKKPLPATDIDGSIREKYEDSEVKEDTEAEELNQDEQLPNYGVQVKAEYTMFAHFLAVKALFGKVDKYRFFLDQDSGIRGAFMNAYKEEVKAKTADAFFVSIDKNMSTGDKRRLNNQAIRNLKEFMESNPSLTENQAILLLLKQSILATQPIGKWGDKWVNHPFPTMAEPLKKMCWLTEDPTMDIDHKAWLYNKASLHGVDSFFMKIRRRVNMFERSLHSSANVGRVWNGYGAYDPSMVVKLLDIYRVVHNYIDCREESELNGKFDKKGKALYNRWKTTPAMRIGLTGKPFTYEEVLYFDK